MLVSELEKKADNRIRTPTRVNKIQIGISFNGNELLQFLGKEPRFFICLCFKFNYILSLLAIKSNR